MEVATVSQALRQFYLSPLSSPRERRRADSLLQKFQKSPEATLTALRVLKEPITRQHTQDESIKQQVEIDRKFYASTIYQCIAEYVKNEQYDYKSQSNGISPDIAQQQIVQAQFQQLCQEVWTILISNEDEHRAVRIHLALTISVIFLRFHDPQATGHTLLGDITWLLNTQSHPQPNPNLQRYCLLLVMKSIPEEVSNKRVKFIKSRREMGELLVQSCAAAVIGQALPSISQELDAVSATVSATETTNMDIHLSSQQLLLTCFSSWVTYGHVVPLVILQSGLLERSFLAAKTWTLPSLSDAAFLVVRDVVRHISKSAQSLPREETRNIMIPLIQLVMNQFVEIGKEFQVQNTVPPSPTLSIHLLNTVKAIVDCGECLIMHLFDLNMESQDSLEVAFFETVLYFTALPDLEISNETMSFWIRFRSFMAGGNHPEQRARSFDIFITRLLNILLERSTYPLDYEQFSSEQKIGFSEYRSEVRAVFRSIATVTMESADQFVVSTVNAIFQQYDEMEAAVISSVSNPEATDNITIDSEQWWRRTETFVHALSAVSKSIRERDTTIIPRLFHVLSRSDFPAYHPALAKSITVLVGVTSHWFLQHPQSLNTSAFKILSYSFQMPQNDQHYPFKLIGHTDHSGAVTLLQLANRCGSQLYIPQWIDAMLQLYQATLATEAPCISIESLQLVVDALATVIATVPYAQSCPVVDEALRIIMNTLKVRFASASVQDNAKLMCMIFDHLRGFAIKLSIQIDQSIEHPLLCVLPPHWPTLTSAVCTTFQNFEEVRASFCRFLQSMFDTLQSQAYSFAMDVMASLPAEFSRTQDGNYIKVVHSALVATGRSNSSGNSTCVQVLTGLMATTCALIEGTSVDDHPIVLSSLFNLITSTGDIRSPILVESRLLDRGFTLALAALHDTQDCDIGKRALSLIRGMLSWIAEVDRLSPRLRQSSELRGKIQLAEMSKGLLVHQDGAYHVLIELFRSAGGLGMCSNGELIEEVSELMREFWRVFGKEPTEQLMLRVLQNETLFTPESKSIREEFAVTLFRRDCTDHARKFKRILLSFCDRYFRKLQQ